MVEPREKQADEPYEGAVAKEIGEEGVFVGSYHIQNNEQQNQDLNDEASPYNCLVSTGHVAVLKPLIHFELLFQWVLGELLGDRVLEGETTGLIIAQAPRPEQEHSQEVTCGSSEGDADGRSEKLEEAAFTKSLLIDLNIFHLALIRLIDRLRLLFVIAHFLLKNS